MLVLSRQRDETIMIGDKIEITIVDVRGEKVRLGINAPTHITVHRKEVYDAITRENADAAQLSGEDLTELRPPDTGASPPERARELVSTPTPRPTAASAAPSASAGTPAAIAPHASETDSESARGLRRSA